MTATRLGIAAEVPTLDGPDAVDLLDPHAVVDAALAAGADAVHPGYGFLAESPDLAAAVLAAGLTWVGPPPAAIRSLGDKAEARALARRVGVPVADGEEPRDQSDASLAAVAGRIGYPVLVKPVAGGGGKGIRVVAAADGLAAALAAARREARRAFGDERLLLERYVEDARHVEVQVLGDAHGSIAALGDRDCSLQRRHQKVVEEAPAPGLDPALRRSLRDAAVRLAAAVGYVNAGTCEFLVGRDAAFVFLELNARLQVEHPVTEAVLGRDLVADQLAVADGATLASLGLDDPAAIEARIVSGGHAIEVRINAEDPARGFLPSTGRVVAVRWPAGTARFGPAGERGVRLDAGIEVGDVIGGRFDPLLAKVVAHGPDRAVAVSRLAAALDSTEVLGLATNLAFLRRLVRLTVVVQARARIQTIEGDPEVGAATRAGAGEPLPDAAWQAAARQLVGVTGPTGAWGGAWRPNLPPQLRLVADAGDGPVERSVALGVPGGDAGVDGRPPAALPRTWHRRPTPPRTRRPRPTSPQAPPSPVATATRSTSRWPARASPSDWRCRRRTSPGTGRPGGTTGADGGPKAGWVGDVRAPMPGLVVGVHVVAGSILGAGARIATIEAMKMEHDVTAPEQARVAEILVREGEQVERGRVVARLGALDGGGDPR